MNNVKELSVLVIFELSYTWTHNIMQNTLAVTNWSLLLDYNQQVCKLTVTSQVILYCLYQFFTNL